MFTTGPGSPSVLQNRKFGFVETKTVQSPGGFAVALTSELVFAPSSSETSPAVNEDASTGPPASRPLSWGSSVDVSEGLGEGFKMLMLGGEDDAISSAISAFGDSSAAKPTHAHNHGYLLARQQRFAEADRSFSETMRTEAKGGSAKTMFHLASLKQLYLNEEATDPAEKARHLEVRPSPHRPLQRARAGRGCGSTWNMRPPSREDTPRCSKARVERGPGWARTLRAVFLVRNC